MTGVRRFIIVSLVILGVLCFMFLVEKAVTQPSPGAAATLPSVVSGNWPMFHHDRLHTGVAGSAPGKILEGIGPAVRWRYQVAIIPGDEISATRWTSTFPLGDLDGNGTLEVVVTSPGTAAGPNNIMALEDRPGESPPVHRMWLYTTTTTVDMYSPVLALANDDALLDVIFTEGNGTVRALNGLNGQPIWEYATGRATEAGPTAGNMDGAGGDEIVIATACAVFGEACPPGHEALLVVLPAAPIGPVSPTWEVSYTARLDSSVPALADIDPNDGQERLAIIAGSWGGELVVAWQRADLTVIRDTFDLRTLDITATLGVTPAIRSSPLVYDFGNGPTAVFGWVPDPRNPGTGRLSAIRLEADMTDGEEVQFTPLWTEHYDAWKSSVTLLPVSDPPLIATGYGLAAPPYGLSGPVGACEKEYLFGGIVALNIDGSHAWINDFGHDQGNVRASAAVADMDGDGELEIILPVGCFGKIYAYDGLTGEQEWERQLGPRSQNSPSIGDLDGDGASEIVVGSYDGYVWVLGGSPQTYLPLISR
jgi:outer membrane protein assembly factor BamB